MKVKHIDHIGVAVKSIEEAGKFYKDILGLRIEEIESVADQKVNIEAFLVENYSWPTEKTHGVSFPERS